MKCPADVTIKELHPQKHDPLHVKQEESEMPNIKQEEEPETHSIKEEVEDEIPKFPMTVGVKSEDDEGPSKESGAAKPSSDSSFQHLTTKGEGRSQPDDITVEDLHPEKHGPPHVGQEESEMLCVQQEAEPETPNIKEEHEGEIPKFPMTVSVKSEEDEGPSEVSTAAKLASNSLFQYLTTKSEGRSQPDDLLAPLSDSNDLTSHSSDFNTDEEDVDFEQNASKSLNKSSRKTDAKECVDVTVEDLHPEKHDPSYVKQQEPEMLYIYEEAEPQTPSIKEEQEDEIPKFPRTVSVKSEEDEGPSEASQAVKLASCNLFQDLTTKDVTVEDLHPKKHDHPYVKQQESEMPYIKQEAEPETPSIIDKQEDEIPKFPMTVGVNSKEDEGPSEASQAVKLSSCNLFQDLTTKGEGRSQPDDLLSPLSDSDDVTSHSSDFNTDEEDVDIDASKTLKKASRKRHTKECLDVTMEDLHPEEKHDPPYFIQQESEMPCIKQKAAPESPGIKEEQEDEIPKFPMTVGVNSEEDEGPSKESRAAKLATSSFFQHLTTKGEGRSPPDDLLWPLSDSDDVTSHSSDFNTDEEDVDFDASKSLNESSLTRDTKECADVTMEDTHPVKPDPPHFEQGESEMPYIEQEAEQEIPSIKEEQEGEIPKCSMTVSVKSEEGEGPSEERRAAKLASSSLFQYLNTKDITVEELHLEKHDPPHVMQKESEMSCVKQEAEPESPNMKEHEDGIPKFSMTVSVKSEEDEGPSKVSTAAKLASSSLFQYLPTKGEGRSQPDALLATLSDSDDVTSHTSDFSTDEEDVDFDASKSSKRSSLKRETKECPGGKPISCSHCDKTFTTKKKLIRHTHTHSEEKPFLCTFCGKRFTQKGNLNRHTKIHTGEKPFICSVCDKGFCGKQDLIRHTSTHTGVKPFGCTLCGKRFRDKRDLSNHTITHTGEKPFVCSPCDKRFLSKRALTKHTRTHNGENPFVCTFCGTGFTQKGNLKVHTRKHTGEKPFVCSLCDERFFTKNELTRHTSIHTGEKPLVCSVCDKRFFTKNELTRHANIHTGEKPFACKLCDKRFAQNNGLIQHIQTHSEEQPFACTLCDKRYFTKQGLKVHTNTHTGEKPFVCTLCGKRFTQKASLKAHTRIHTGEKPFVCSLCDKRFFTKQELTSHTYIHTK
ncbi:zinc finger and SCAN domain-containing protein 10-like isoform X2 [Corythoichthys intestinalis]|uniref:zinc finger and SCAN domain-containing protein 10-like isoform X2 n=1 Tax=Corythoichthys intestinalis TaxID=161448 RepID=UPI0025A5C943|nr:zinc finger and SCAN domain-containing protein 10-like isoform X2 [Corythoichthys intestinalis]